MGILTAADHNAISTILDKKRKPGMSPECKDAYVYLRKLMSTKSDDMNIINAINNKLSNFYVIRSVVAPASKGTLVDEVRDYIFDPIRLFMLEPRLKHQAIGGMLSEIFDNIKVDDTDIDKDNQDEELLDTSLINYYTLAVDLETSLENLYPHTAKTPTKEYVKNYPLAHIAVECLADNFLKILVAKNENVPNTALLEQCLDSNKDNLLHHAARRSNHNAVQILLDAGANVNAVRGNRLLTALILAVDQDVEQTKTVSALLQSLEINIEHKRAWALGMPDNAWDIAKKRKHTDIIGLLLPRMKEFWLMTIDNSSVQDWALLNGEKNVITALAKKNLLNFESVYSSGSVMHCIAMYGYIDAYNAIEDRKPYLNLRNKYKQTPLLVALYNGKKEMAENLMNDGADLTCIDHNDQTLWHMVGWRAYISFIEKIDKQSIDINALDNKKFSALHTAVFANTLPDKDTSDRIAMVAFLLERSSEATVTTVTRRGTLIDIAVDNEAPGVLAVLVADKRINVKRRVNGESLLEIAEKNNWPKVIEALKARGVEDKKVPVIEVIKPPPPVKKTYFELEVALLEKNNEIEMLKKQVASMMDTPTQGVLFSYSEKHKIREVANNTVDKDVLATFKTSWN